MPLTGIIDRFLMSEWLYRIPALLLAITLHELAHGLVAYKLGDNTAKEQGRLTLNPIKHIDPLGLIALFLVRFGWAKPVPVNPRNFRGDWRRGLFLVGLAGPLTNFLLAFLAALLLVTIPFLHTAAGLQFMRLVIMYNVYFGVFNLLPFPPLDGSKVIQYFLPSKMVYHLSRLEQYGPLILILLIFTGVLQRILIGPANAVINIISIIVAFLTGVI